VRYKQSERASANYLHAHLTSYLRWITKLRTIGVKRSTPARKKFGLATPEVRWLAGEQTR
jgi:hypothetical protein